MYFRYILPELAGSNPNTLKAVFAGNRRGFQLFSALKHLWQTVIIIADMINKFIGAAHTMKVKTQSVQPGGQNRINHQTASFLPDTENAANQIVKKNTGAAGIKPPSAVYGNGAVF